MVYYRPTGPHLWLVGTIPPRRGEDCRSTSKKKRRTHTYHDLTDLLIELALERENDSHMRMYFGLYMVCMVYMVYLWYIWYGHHLFPFF